MMTTDRNGMVVLSEAECLRRLGDRGIGRVGVSIAALPAIFPVTYAVRDGDIYFRTGPGTKLGAATRHAVVAFQIDRVDRMSHRGWSVLVVGRAEVVRTVDELDALQDLPLTRWVSGGPETLIRLRTELVSGREIRPTPDIEGSEPCVDLSR